MNKAEPTSVTETEQSLPLGPTAQRMIEAVQATQYRSELNRFSGRTVLRRQAEGLITSAESSLIFEVLKAQKRRMTLSPEASIPLEIPESTMLNDDQSVGASLLSPADILETMGGERDFDCRERAAAEYKDRD